MNNTKRNIRIIATVLVVVLVACTFVGRALYTARMPQVTAVEVERGRLQFTAMKEGNIIYTDMVQIIADVDFIIEEVFFNIGNPIKEGEPLLRINMEQYQESHTRIALKRQHLENAIWDIDEEILEGGSTERLEMQRSAYVLELEVLYSDGQGSEILHHGIEHEGHLIDGVVLAPTFGRIIASVEGGQQTLAGEELFLIVPDATGTEVAWYMTVDEAVHFERSMSAYFTYLSGARRVEEFVSSTNVSRNWDGRLQLWRYNFPYETIQRNLFGVTGELFLIHETTYYDTIVPTSAVFFDEFGIPSVYILSIRTGLFGLEKYVFTTNVHVIEMSPKTTAVSSINLRLETLVISNPSDELYNGATVWAENLGVEAFSILGD
jgi:hypothetical protein